SLFLSSSCQPPGSLLFPYTTLFRSSFTKAYRAFGRGVLADPKTQVTLKTGWNKERTIPEEAFPDGEVARLREQLESGARVAITLDRKSTRLNSSHLGISYAVFCLKK